jgi:hypothetical protein
MSVKCLLMLVATVMLGLASVGCTTMQPPPSGEAQLLITIRATEGGEIMATVVGRDGRELPQFRVNAANPLLSLRERFEGKQIKGGGPLTIAVLGASPECLCSCMGGICACEGC